MPLLAEFCFDCHSGDLTEADVNLEQLTASDSFAASFKTWRRVETMLHSGKMPPEDMPQPTDDQRRQLVDLIRKALRSAADQQSGDPGEVVLRRLTSAEYAYTIEDLTGLSLDLGRDFVDDAVGGEGFANTGVAQFMQDSALERYLEAARRVAAHAVIGAGPLTFYRDPGETGRELYAIQRIQSIYRTHGFRTAAGEGGKAFGLDAYPNAFYAAWRFRFRDQLDASATLADLAAEQGVSARFIEHIWSVLTSPSPTFPTSEIVAQWNDLPKPGDVSAEQLEEEVQESCERLLRSLRNWQRRLARAASHNEEASILAAGPFTISDEQLQDGRIDWPDELSLDARRTGVLEFANHFPQVSHREPAPSDRDPIPLPFDNTYNEHERNYFHTHVKYHRDDRFLVEHILDDAARAELDAAWADLLTSFDYHATFLGFIAEKYKLELDGRGIAELDDPRIDSLADEPRKYIRHLRDEYGSMQQAVRAAQPQHVTQAVAFASRAWRRPLTGDEEARLAAFYESLRQNGGLDHTDALRGLIARILVAPEFLYRVEMPGEGPEHAPLSDWELASRLSYFLWSSLPDAKLREAAAAGDLREPDELARHARRMLADEKARRLATEFFGQWFGFYRFDRYRGVDSERFPEFTDALKGAMYEEAIAFFEHIVRSDRPVREILFADYAFLNDDLAEHYGIELEDGLAIRRTSRDEEPAQRQAGSLSHVAGVNRDHRGGLLRLGAVLTATSAPLRTSPVKRGDWVLRRVLGTPVPPPPPDAGSIAADDVLADGLTVRQRLEAHRRDASCAGCHSRMDPLGFALEHYDPLGRWRDAYRDGQPIDASGTLGDGTHISGPDGLRDYLEVHEGLFQRTLCTKLIGYALGRSEIASDRQLVEQMMTDLADQGRFSDLVMRIVTSRQFGYGRPRALIAGE